MRTIHNIDVFGDSVSDRAYNYASAVMGKLSGLVGKTGKGRFADEYVWTDYFAVSFGKDSGFERINLDDPTYVTTESGNTILRSFAAGGLPAAEWSILSTFRDCNIFDDLDNAGARAALPTLDSMFDDLCEDNIAADITKEELASHLTIGWTGANDLLTQNNEVTYASADKAVAARLAHIEKMIALGYRNICVINLPDLSKTPRFQRADVTNTVQQHVSNVCKHFNDKLAAGIEALQKKHSHEKLAPTERCQLDIFDAAATFDDVEKNCEAYGFDRTLMKTPWTETDEFKRTEDKAYLIAEKHAYWDDVHITSKLHKILALKIRNFLKQRYILDAKDAPQTKMPPNSAQKDQARLAVLINNFKEAFGRIIAKSWLPNCCLFCCTPKLAYKNPNLTLEDIVYHHLKHKDGTTKEAMQKLGWLDKDGKLNPNHHRSALLAAAFQRVQVNINVQIQTSVCASITPILS